MPDKLPQPNYEKRLYKKNNSSFIGTEENNKDSLPEIKISQKININNIISNNNNPGYIRKKNEKLNEKEMRDSEKKEKENSEERERQYQERNSIGNHLPTQIGTKEDNNNRGYLNNDQIISIPKKKRRIDNNDRSLDNIISHNIYLNALNGSAINSSNIKILKSENNEFSNNNSIVRDKSPYDESPNLNLKKKSKDLMMLPNIRHQQNYDNK